MELVIGFCAPEQYQRFLSDTPHFAEMLVVAGVHLRKCYLSVTGKK